MLVKTNGINDIIKINKYLDKVKPPSVVPIVVGATVNKFIKNFIKFYKKKVSYII